jgi:hypothetical protein
MPNAKRVAVVAALVEGNSIGAAVRMTNVSKPTILELLAELGQAWVAFQERLQQDAANHTAAVALH